MVKVKSSKRPVDQDRKFETQQTLKKMRRESEEEIASAYAKSLSLPYIDLNISPINVEEVRLIPEEEAEKYKVGLFLKRGRNVRLATTTPTAHATVKYVKTLQEEKGWKIRLFMVSQTSFNKLIAAYKETSLIEYLNQLHIQLTGKDLDNFEKEFGDIIKLKERITELPTSELITTVFSGAIKLGASDIHFEPEKEKARLRYRIDGILQDVGYLPYRGYKLVLSRVKMLGKMKLNIRKIAQDGHFAVKVSGVKSGEVDVRASILPSRHGESIVMRLLNQNDVLVNNIEHLGLRGLSLERVQNNMGKPNGMILTTGPTGSGKTTTLYAILNKLNTSDVKIITIENPIEYEIKGISQTQVSHYDGYTFAKGLRAIVRQDPDIILVGEIRDDETADIALNAALTGHLVLSTLHTNNASASVARLVELGVKPNLIPPAVNVFMAQRLVRRLCDCKEEYAPAEETLQMIKEILSIISPKAKVSIPKDITKMYRPKGCKKCNGIGYKGRVGLYEVMEVNDEMQSLIEEMATVNDIMRAALENGMITIAQDGILKAVMGETSVEEVWRVSGQVDFLREIYTQLMEQMLGRSMYLKEDLLKDIVETANTKEKFTTYMETVDLKDSAEALMAGAAFFEAGDVHIEPDINGVNIRFRIDGMLQQMARIPFKDYPQLLGKIKVVSGLKSEVRAGVVDSRFTLKFEKTFGPFDKNIIDIRVSLILSGYGETVVLRLLDHSDKLVDIESLGLRGRALERMHEAIQKPNGMIITTGPTGSGKTTTLYSILSRLNQPNVKIVTIEDPIEYELEGISQTQVDKGAGYTFDNALRLLLRQNPDIIMLGEIRDGETASSAVQAALTGHLMLSTLHTNDAAGAIPRFVELGIRPSLISEAANILIAQRLVRKLCQHCRVKYTPSDDVLQSVNEAMAIISPKAKVDVPKEIRELYRPGGCEKCNGIGYKERVGVFEVIEVNENLHKLIEDVANIYEITHAALEDGMITMAQDGILKAVEGETSVEEVWRVAGNQIDFLREIYGKIMEQSLGRSLPIQEKVLQNIVQKASTKEKFSEYIREVELDESVEAIMAGAMYFRAGDVHIEPDEEGVNIRFRIDGMLQNMARLSFNEYPQILGKIKLMSGLKAVEVRGGVVDSRFVLKPEKVFGPFGADAVDVRVSIILGGYGETAVIRLLDKSAVALNVNTIGIRKENLEKILEQIEKPNGIILNTGPTGSGKSTTLYSLLGKLNTPEVKIMTVEDPIEYQMNGLLQTQVNEKGGYSFSNALRSLLRQNPDIIMVGEIRDEETAVVAVQAALTGHLVFTTLHTNDAIGAIPRLINMGVRPEDIANGVNCFMAQRLVRILCSCKKSYEPEGRELKILENTLATISPKSGLAIPKTRTLYKPVGCAECQGIGYKHMTTVTEVAVMDSDMKEHIYHMDPITKIQETAIANGMIMMEQDGAVKALEGITSLDEVRRVTKI